MPVVLVDKFFDLIFQLGGTPVLRHGLPYPAPQAPDKVLRALFLTKAEDVLPRRANIELRKLLKHHAPHRMRALGGRKVFVLPSHDRDILTPRGTEHRDVAAHEQVLIEHLPRRDPRVFPTDAGSRVPTVRRVEVTDIGLADVFCLAGFFVHVRVAHPDQTPVQCGGRAGRVGGDKGLAGIIAQFFRHEEQRRAAR